MPSTKKPKEVTTQKQLPATSLEPGVYLGLSNEAYHADRAVSSSSIKKLIVSPLKYWWSSPLNPARAPEKKTTALTVGQAYHTLVLEPEKGLGLEVKKGVNSSTEEGKIGEGDYTMIQAMAKEVRATETRRKLLEGGVAEVSVFWRDKETGIMCKCRYDYFAPGWIVDLKSCSDVSDRALRYVIGDYGYDVSGAMYSIGASMLKDMLRNGYELPDGFPKGFKEEFLAEERQLFAFMVQEKEPPYMTRTKLLTGDVAGVGRDKFRKGLDVYYQHQELTGQWPTGYPELEDILLDDLAASIQYF